MRALILKFCGLLLLVGCFAIGAKASSIGEIRIAVYQEHVQPLVQKFCIECHDKDVAKAGLRLDLLTSDFDSPETFSTWMKIHDKLAGREMPPAKRAQPPDSERETALQWIARELTAAESRHREAEGRTVIRRLNRNEYQNTIRDLLALDVDLRHHLPQDPSAHGFDTVGTALNLSPELMECYLEAADAALDAAIATGVKPEAIRQRYSYKQDKAGQYPKIFRIKDDAVVLFGTCCAPTALTRFCATRAGRYRFQISTYAYQSARPVTFRVYAGRLLEPAGGNHLIDYFQALPRPGVVEFEHRLEVGDTIQVLPYGTGEDFKRVDPVVYKGPGLAVQWIDIEGPLHPAWPPESHRRLFGDLPLKASRPPLQLAVYSEQPLQDSERLLREFLPRAFRRPVTEADLQPYLNLARQRLHDGFTFEQAMRTAYRAVLTAPSFVLRVEHPGKLTDHALASRLSYFLWSSMPDERLFTLATEGSLIRDDVLHGEVERMLASPKAQEFVRDFTGQWLGLRKINDTSPDEMLYPEFDEWLKVSMVRETELFFAEMLKHDLGVENFIDSDFSMLNERLARHYGIAGVEGLDFHNVRLPKNSHRGGLLAQAAILKITANGATTSPVLRGAWVLENLLGQKPPPPPTDVAAIEPDIRGATTVREQLAKHRSVESCASCHQKIDPPGFALENFDVTGSWREFYRSAGEGEPVALRVNGEAVRYRKGPAVDASGVMPNAKTFQNFDTFKQLLRDQHEQVARCIAGKLLTYATGEGITFSDRAEIERLLELSRQKNGGLRTLVHAIVQSERFRTK